MSVIPVFPAQCVESRMNSIVRDRLKSIHSALAERRPLTGAWLFMGCPIATEVMAHGAFDFLILDTEHAPGSKETLYHQIRACDAAGMPVIVRLPTTDHHRVITALDAGASGVAVANVRYPEQVVELVRSVRYAPEGERGTHRLARAANYGLGWPNYFAEIAPNLLTIALIETAEGVNSAEAICAVDGLDAVFIGEVDLAASLGKLDKPDHPDVTSAKQRIVDAARAAGVAIGGLATGEAASECLFEAGYSISTIGSDLAWLRDRVAQVKPRKPAWVEA